MSKDFGVLYVVATPIGNLSDASDRMKKILSDVDLIVAEDTRHTKGLLQHFGINNRLMSYHKFNESEKTDSIIQQMLEGSNVALVSDAGTPCISDPGMYLVDAAHKQNIKVNTVPGACAVSAAISISGFDATRYSFHGFLSSKSGQRKTYFSQLTDSDLCQVFYESPHRITAFIKDAIEIFGEARECGYCRELTKVYETAIQTTLGELLEIVTDDKNQQKGEIVFIIKGNESIKDTDGFSEPLSLDFETMVEALSSEMKAKSIVNVMTKLNPSLKKNDIYKKVLEILG